MARRIGVMADGRIGRVAVELLVRSYPDRLHALVTTGGSQDELLPDNCRRFSGATFLEGSADALSTCNLDVLILAWSAAPPLEARSLKVAPTILNTARSLLPTAGGKDPNFWAIVEQVPFGVTIHHVDATTDGGA